ncbi:MAG: hypothetical protein ACJZ5X_03325 [Opitutales bacterium]
MKSIFLPFLLFLPVLILFAQYDPSLFDSKQATDRRSNFDQSYDYSSPSGFEGSSLLTKPATTSITNSSYALPVAGFVPSQRKKNAFSYYLGFSQPIDYGFIHLDTGHRLELDHDYGVLMEFEYRRYIKDFHIGISNMYQSYKHHQLSNVPGLLVPGPIEVDGYNGVFAVMAHVGWSPQMTEKIFLESRFSLGLAYNIDEITVFSSQLKDEYTEMIYSAQLGLGYRFDNSMTLSFIWKLLGQSTKDRFDNFLFHSAGLRLGYDF